MARPWQTLDAVQTPDGELKLLARDTDDVMITHCGRVLMVSRGSRSEEALARLTCPPPYRSFNVNNPSNAKRMDRIQKRIVTWVSLQSSFSK